MYGRKKKTRTFEQTPETEMFQEFTEQAIDLENKRREFMKHIERQVHANFVSKGGCSTCRGRGWVVTENVDGNEYAVCPEIGCTKETRDQTGLDAGFDSHDRSHGLINPCGPANPMYTVLVGPIDQLIRSLMSKIVKERKELQKKNQD